MLVHGLEINDSAPGYSTRSAIVRLAAYYDPDNIEEYSKQYQVQDYVGLSFDPSALQDAGEYGLYYDGPKVMQGITDLSEKYSLFTAYVMYALAEKKVLHIGEMSTDIRVLSQCLFNIIQVVPSFDPNKDVDMLMDGVEQLTVGYSVSQALAVALGKQSVEDKMRVLASEGLRKGDYGLVINLTGQHTVRDNSFTTYSALPENPTLVYIKDITKDSIVVQYIPEIYTVPETIQLWRSLENREMMRDLLKPKHDTHTQTIPLMDLSIEYHPNFNETTIISPLDDLHIHKSTVWMGVDPNTFDADGEPMMDHMSERMAIYTALAQHGYSVPEDVTLPWYAKPIHYNPPHEIDETVIGDEQF